MSYADETEVRLRHGLHAEDVINESVEVQIGDTEFRLNKRAYFIISIEKNGVSLSSPADFSFIPPKKITLTASVQADDFFDVLSASELPSETIVNLIIQATETIKSILEQRFGEDTLIDWETVTPPLIARIAAQLAGYEAERSMLRKGHKFDPKNMEMLNTEMNRLLKQLMRLANGTENVPGEDPIGGDPIASRTGGKAFVELKDVASIDHQELDDELGLDGQVLSTAGRGRIT